MVNEHGGEHVELNGDDLDDEGMKAEHLVAVVTAMRIRRTSTSLWLLFRCIFVLSLL